MNMQFFKKSIIYLFLLLFVLQTGFSQQILSSGKKNILFRINGTGFRWSINPALKPDRLKVYFDDDETNVVEFVSDIDSLSFEVHNLDTVRFSILFNNKDTALTEIIGVHNFPNNFSDEEKLYYLGVFWSEVKYNFMNYDNLSFDWDSLYQTYIPLVLNTENDFEYYQILKSFAASLHDGHTEIYDNSQFRVYLDYIPVTLKSINGKVYIVSYRESLKDKLEIGGEIVMINGIPAKQFLEEKVFPYVSASTEGSKWAIGLGKLTFGPKNEPLTVKYKKLNGEYKTVLLKRNGESTRYDLNGNEKYKMIGYSKKFKRNLDLEFTVDSIAILNYSRFYPEKETIDEFESLVPKLLRAKGLVIDLRNNRGGATNVSYSLIKRITPENYFLGLAAETRINDAVYKALGIGYEKYKLYYENKAYRQELSDTIWISDDTERIKCPVVILIGENTFSAAEDFLLMIYEIQGRPLLIGSPTAGSTGAPLVIPDLPGGGYARICARRCKYPYSGKPFINKGIQPDISIYPTIDDIIENKDVVLQKGIELIRENKTNK